MVEKLPNNFVLKPQREGGGNNIYGENILKMMKSLTPEELKAYILMQKIKPVPRLGFLVKKRELSCAPVISELGIFSYFIRFPFNFHFWKDSLFFIILKRKKKLLLFSPN
jgi:glutathione synthase